MEAVGTSSGPTPQNALLLGLVYSLYLQPLPAQAVPNLKRTELTVPKDVNSTRELLDEYNGAPRIGE
jgi:hypothetical protein